MVQESYADYSIIHKYMEQQKLHEEELQRFQDEIRQRDSNLAAATSELDMLRERVDQLSGDNESLRQQLTERDNEVRRLSTTVDSLNKKIAAMTKAGRG
jgi:peptidoglycan hydrolase CwlO-like protein